MSKTTMFARGRFTALALVSMVGGAALLGGCPGTLEDKEQYQSGGSGPSDTGGGNGNEGGNGPGGGAPADDVEGLLKTSCALASCHNAATKALGLDFETAGFGPGLVDKAATACQGSIIDKAAPDQSVLYTKLLATPACGARMPLGGTPLTDAQIQSVLAWIQGLAAGGT